MIPRALVLTLTYFAAIGWCVLAFAVATWNIIKLVRAPSAWRRTRAAFWAGLALFVISLPAGAPPEVANLWWIVAVRAAAVALFVVAIGFGVQAGVQYGTRAPPSTGGC